MSTLSDFITLFVILGFIALFFWSIIWAYSDAEKRGKSGCLVALLVALVSWPLGLLLWLVFRPEEKSPPSFRR